VELATERELQLVASTPIAKGKVAKEPTIVDIANAHDRTPVQVALRWLVQRGIGAIPKAARRAQLEENFRIFDFELTDDELERISSLGRNQRLVDPGWAPEWD
jgi:diketogulonate reductase-like aldo/keto reductase